MIRNSTTRDQRRASHQRDMVDAAVLLLERDGAAGLTMPALAAQLGAAVGALYRWFPSKQALVVALQLRAIEELSDLLEIRLGAVATSADPLDPPRAAFGTWAVWAARSPALFDLVDSALSDPRRQLDDDGVRPVDDAMNAVLGTCAETLALATRRGALAPGDDGLRALAMFAAVRGAHHLHKRDPRVTPGHAAALVEAHLVQTLLQGYAVR